MAPQPNLAFSSFSSGDEVFPATALQTATMTAPANHKPQLAKSKKSSSMPRATSMLEMSEVHDMVSFGEQMAALSGQQTLEAIADDPGDDGGFFADDQGDDGGGFFADDHGDDDGGFFIDDQDQGGGGGGGGFFNTSEHSDEDAASRMKGNHFLQGFSATEQAAGPAGGSARPTGIPAAPAPNRPAPSAPAFVPPPTHAKIGGLRRVMSLASLPSARRFSLTSISPIHTICEEDIVDSASESETAEVGLDASIQSRRPYARNMSSRGSSASLCEMGLDASVSSRKPFQRVSSKASLSSNSGLPRSLSSAMLSSRATGLDSAFHDSRPVGRRTSSSSAPGLNGSVHQVRRSASSASLTSPGLGMPLRSSMKGSRNNLRSSGGSINGDCPPSGMRRVSSSVNVGGMPLRSSMKGSRNNLLRMGGGSSNGDCPPVNVGGMPLRSSMKGSRNNLRSLSSSIKSVNSVASSIPSMDDTNHSIESAEDKEDDANKTTIKRNISFASVEIRSYNVTLGNAPTQNGPPVTLDWDYDPNTQEHCIEEYEADRADNRRQKHEMHMPKSHREYLLMREAGFSRTDIEDAMNEAKRCARQRAKTARRSIKLQPMEEAIEKAKRTLSFKRK